MEGQLLRVDIETVRLDRNPLDFGSSIEIYSGVCSVNDFWGLLRDLECFSEVLDSTDSFLVSFSSAAVNLDILLDKRYSPVKLPDLELSSFLSVLKIGVPRALSWN